MRILNEANPGDFGLIYWNEKTSYEVSEERAQEMRQKSISDMINATLQTNMYSSSNQQMGLDTAMQRGWNEANKNIEMIQNGTETRNEMFLIGDPNTIPRLVEIESDPNFRGWMNPYLIEQIKSIESNI
jgi:hypothetical protein